MPFISLFLSFTDRDKAKVSSSTCAGLTDKNLLDNWTATQNCLDIKHTHTDSVNSFENKIKTPVVNDIVDIQKKVCGIRIYWMVIFTII